MRQCQVCNQEDATKIRIVKVNNEGIETTLLTLKLGDKCAEKHDKGELNYDSVSSPS